MMIKMWEKINEKFKKYPARMKVAEKMIELGLSLNNDGKIYCGNLKISDKALAIAADVDRRAIKSTIEIIQNDEDLFNIFSNVLPAGTLLKNIAKNLNLGVIEIEVGSQNEGILAAITKIISNIEKNKFDEVNKDGIDYMNNRISVEISLKKKIIDMEKLERSIKNRKGAKESIN